ncbi:hypothetical protein FGO68_gene5440 [Halteria grandinella]|uniref:Secreted protein n=1 Tax=Halteria grandinella TaxID=5974 RepID=A0A8J8SWV1_HALGN|nr:hypothetical protein FGO68_gene5440 [Halteria grandinella]
MTVNLCWPSCGVRTMSPVALFFSIVRLCLASVDPSMMKSYFEVGKDQYYKGCRSRSNIMQNIILKEHFNYSIQCQRSGLTNGNLRARIIPQMSFNHRFPPSLIDSQIRANPSNKSCNPSRLKSKLLKQINSILNSIQSRKQPMETSCSSQSRQKETNPYKNRVTNQG